jgi:hypothetical protein
VPEPPGDEPIYLVLEDVLELYAAIIDASAAGGRPAARPRRPRGGAGPTGGLRPLRERRSRPAGRGPRAWHRRGPVLLDGNKRLALVALLTFLEVNGHRVVASDPGLAGWILDLAAGATPDDLAARIRAVLIPADRR